MNRPDPIIQRLPTGYIHVRFSPQVFVQFPVDFRGDDIEQFVFESGGTSLMRAEVRRWWDRWRATARPDGARRNPDLPTALTLAAFIVFLMLFTAGCAV